MYDEFVLTEEFKRNVVQLLLLRTKSAAQIEAQFHIPSGLPLVWVNELGLNHFMDAKGNEEYSQNGQS